MSITNQSITAVDGGSSPLTQVFENAAIPPMAASNAPPLSSTSQLPRLAYSIREAAEILGVSEKSIRRLIDRGMIRPSRALRHLLIPSKELDRFLDETM